jgi:hypothetical protein
MLGKSSDFPQYSVTLYNPLMLRKWYTHTYTQIYIYSILNSYGSSALYYQASNSVTRRLDTPDGIHMHNIIRREKIRGLTPHTIVHAFIVLGEHT